MSDTLVLSQAYEPVGKMLWTRAITLLYERRVEVVENYSDWVVRSVSLEMPVPAVIRRLTATRTRKRKVKFSRENVYLRDKGQCQYCGVKISLTEFTYDHVVPRVQGGKTNWNNVVISCTSCNQRKGGRKPEQARMQLRTVPVQPKNVPGGIPLSLTYRDGMPESWKKWIRDTAYWTVELIQD